LRVLIVRIGAMGDVLHAMPAVAALRQLHPDWEIRWAIEPRWRELLASGTVRSVAMPLVDGWFAVDTQRWKRRGFSMATVSNVLGLRRELRAGRFDLCMDMQGTIRSAMVGRMAGARRFVGMEAPREGVARWLYGERVSLTAAHVVEQGCELLGAAVGEVLRPAKVTLPMDPAAERWCDALRLEGRFVLIAPTAGWAAKQWPAKRYGAVAAALGQEGFGVVVNSWGLDKAADTVVRTSRRFAMAVPCTVGQMIALVRRAALVIGGDTGPVHLAAALERPVVGIYGPTDPVRNGPFGAGTIFPGRVLRDASSVTSHKRSAEAEEGLLRIGVDEVVGAALEVLGEATARTGNDNGNI
jgi:heptosyltransferase I